jgi:integrase
LVSWCGRQAWAAETRRAHRTTYRGFWRWALAEGLVDVDAAAALPRVKPAAPRPRPAPDRVYLATLAAADDRVRMMVRLATELGMRRAEVAQVHARDLVEDLDGWSLVVHGKGARDRLMPMPAALAAAVRTYASEQGGWLFPGRNDGHLSPRWVGKLVGRAMPEGWTMHKLRHRAAVRVHEAGGRDLAVTQDFLGHASPATTRVYLPRNDARLREAVEAAA